MLSLVAGFLLPYVVLAVWGVRTEPWWLNHDPANQRIFVLTILVVPVACGWLGAEVSNFLRPRRLFDRHFRRRWTARALLGLIAGVASAIAGAGLLAVADRYAPDSVLLGSAAAVVGFAAVLPLSRVRRGSCIGCGYDLRNGAAPGQAGAGVCPECGTSVMA
jgi:hypothetical protein